MACSISPLDSVSAFLQSIIPAPVFSRRSLTCCAEISMNPYSLTHKWPPRTISPRGPFPLDALTLSRLRAAVRRNLPQEVRRALRGFSRGAHLHHLQRIPPHP